MKQFVKVDKEELESVLKAASDAVSLLDAVHCYDTEIYENLSKALEEITYESLWTSTQRLL